MFFYSVIGASLGGGNWAKARTQTHLPNQRNRKGTRQFREMMT